MVKQKEIYKCEICGNIVEVTVASYGQLVCCGKPMGLEAENTDDSYGEKHVPIVEGNHVNVGSTEHPMEEKHYIQWIEATLKNGKVERVYLTPSDKPEATFSDEVGSAREYCNLHGAWKTN